MRFFPSAAAAQSHGFRACKRCRPDATPGSPEWDRRADVTARAMRLIADGVVDREGVQGVATRVGYSRRQLERHLRAELGAGPLALARAQRAQTARLLVETTGLAFGDVAFAAGFGSVRQFNDTVREVFGLAPRELRRRAGVEATTASATTSKATKNPSPIRITVNLPFRDPLWPDNLFGHLVATAVPGIEEWHGAAYRRTLRLPRGHGIVALTPGATGSGHANATRGIRCSLALSDLRDLATAISRCRRVLDLDADPVAIDGVLASDPAMAPLVAAAPGRRVPRTVDESELALRAVLGQQISTAAARTHAGRLVASLGEPIEDPDGGLTHLWPNSGAIAEVDPAILALPRPRRATFVALASRLAEGSVRLDPGADRDDARERLLAIPGIGPWTVETIAMRALGDPDAIPLTDLGIRLAAAELGLPSSPGALGSHAKRWQPWSSYAVQHLWATSDHPVNHLPAAPQPDQTDPDKGRAL